MSDIIKWGLLVAAFIAVIAMIIVLPIWGLVNLSEFTNSLTVIVTACSTYFRSARGLINYFTTPFGAYAISVILAFSITKPFVTMSIRIFTWMYHFIFK